MCGLAGILAYGQQAPPVDADELLRMREQMLRRGPDGAGSWVSPDRRVGLGHRRLAIIDLSEDGAQPMTSADGRYRIVFNGEIYNYRELRAQLQRDGRVLRSESDTEVLLHLYEREGAAMCEGLRGMYAFAIWDDRDRSLFLARDPFGIKPLYLHDDGRTLRFASQVKALLAGGAIVDEPEPAGLVGYWIWGHVPEPWTVHRHIVSFAPGSWLRVGCDGRRESGRFESVEQVHVNAAAAAPASPAGGTAPKSLREILLDSVRHHLVADVPVGLFLSSGIDSAVLVSLAAEFGTALRTVTIGFEEYRGTPADETVLAAEVARQYGTRHETVWITRRDFEQAQAEFVDAMDQPSTDGLNTWLVSRAAARLGLKVAISGLGGDELFGGYPSFRQVPRIRTLARPFAGATRLGRWLRIASAPLVRRIASVKFAGLLEYGATWEGAYLLRRATRMPWELERAPFLDADVLAAGMERLFERQRPDPELERLGSPHAIVSYLESTRYMGARLLRDSDWAGMAHSLEIRVPFVDVPLAKHVAAHNVLARPYTKRDLAACARPGLPGALVRRPKTGFTVPVGDWLPAFGGVGQDQHGIRRWQEKVMGR